MVSGWGVSCDSAADGVEDSSIEAYSCEGDELPAERTVRTMPYGHKTKFAEAVIGVADEERCVVCKVVLFVAYLTALIREA